MTDNEELIMKLSHAMQSGIAQEHHLDHPNFSNEIKRELKHLRTGINTALVETGAMVEYFQSKGLLDLSEYHCVLVRCLKDEVKRLEAKLSHRIGAKIVLYRDDDDEEK